MARVEAVLVVRIADVEEFRLLVWELRQLEDDMRVAASPFAERLERAIDRATDRDEADDRDG